MVLVRPPALLRMLYRDLIWRMPDERKDLYLTFDDGPIPAVTPWVLDELHAHNAAATFFVIGANAAARPDLLERIRSEGHTVGNHTWSHENGWRTTLLDYIASIERTQAITGTRLFRPPYGRITRAQSRAVRTRQDIVMWSVLSADYDTRTSEEECLRNVVRHARPGSIIVFHDSVKAEPRLRYALPRVLSHFGSLGYAFKCLPESGIKAARS
ncbi:MAG: polysaccharide deacetylase family protein [Flavobacteriales bacterium]|nr:polysaccharide deacetylase family protein [Flavobacteriales bacterium]